MKVKGNVITTEEQRAIQLQARNGGISGAGIFFPPEGNKKYCTVNPI